MSTRGHICKNGIIKKYPTSLCSKQHDRESTDVIMSEHAIDLHNQKIRQDKARPAIKEVAV